MVRKMLRYQMWQCMMLMALAYISPSTAAPGPEGKKKTQGRAAWIVQTGIPAGMDNPVKVLVGKKIEMLTLSNRVAAGPVKIPQDGLIRLVKEVPHPEKGPCHHDPTEGTRCGWIVVCHTRAAAEHFQGG